MKRLAFLLLLISLPLAAQGPPAPSVTETDPTFAVAGGLGFTITVIGAGFDSGSVVNWNGAARGTIYLSPGLLQASINMADIASAGSSSITVTASGGTSVALPFRIEGTTARVTSWTPQPLTPGIAATVTAYGENFLDGSVMLFDWTAVSTTWISPTQINGAVPGSAIVGSGPHIVRIENPAHPPIAQVIFSPSSFSFGSVAVGNQSAPQTTQITNSGVSGLNFNSIFFGGPSHAEFQIVSSNCPFFILTGTSCLANVAFTPTSTGAFSETLTFSDNAGGTPHILTLAGTGTSGPLWSPSSSSIAFGNIQNGLASAITDTITNAGSANLIFSSNPALSAPISAAVIGASTGTGFAIGDTLSVTGGGGAGAILTVATLSGSSIATFTITAPGDEYTTTTGAALSILTGSGSGDPTADITAGADFSITSDTCLTSTLTPSSTCATQVTFTPSIVGSETAVLSYTDNTGSTPHEINISATGTTAAAAVSFSPTSINFGNLMSGTSSSPVAITLTNPGAATLTGISISITGTGAADFSKTTTCSATLASLANCTISVTFSPAAVASYSAAITVTSSASTSPDNVPLSGKGTAAAAPAVTLSPGALDFGYERTTQTTSALTETVSNTGDASLTTTTIAITGAAFSQSGSVCTNGGTVAAGASCTIGIVFSPTVAGAASGTVTITDTAAGSPHTFGLSGTGVLAHSAILTWPASNSSSVIGYNVYRGTASGGPYTKLTATPINVLTFTDSTVANSTTYYYVVTSVGTNPPYVFPESSNSAQVAAVVGP